MVVWEWCVPHYYDHNSRDFNLRLNSRDAHLDEHLSNPHQHITEYYLNFLLDYSYILFYLFW